MTPIADWERLAPDPSGVLLQALVTLGRLGRRRRRPPARRASPGELLLLGPGRLTERLTCDLIRFAGGRGRNLLVLWSGAMTDVPGALRRFGVAKLQVVGPGPPAVAEGPRDRAAAVSAADLVILDGDERSFLGVLRRDILQAVEERRARGLPVAARGGAASILARRWVGVSPRGHRRCRLRLVPGLLGAGPEAQAGEGGLSPARLLAMASALARGDLVLSLGPGSGAVYQPPDELVFVGGGSALVVDWPAARGSLRPRLRRAAPLLPDLAVHVLASGARFDLALRRPLLQDRDRPDSVGAGWQASKAPTGTSAGDGQPTWGRYLGAGGGEGR
ncbi:MAG: hypothetical protein K6T75_07260 [Acetobacteraceae bacterium]|nr:hypothetical protein [Acetobacteraceae bacterium]